MKLTHTHICICTHHFLLDLEADLLWSMLLQSILLLLLSRDKQHGAKWVGGGRCMCPNRQAAFIHSCLSGSKCNINHKSKDLEK